ncbi:pisatin demethylase cytochrome P450 [Fusarium tjaetaba]|uniref:Pisatin demethylase cytochrome P450 n=1 Tax=Fusarium tjaetaba TaxID=1567544 RepID=A0A8H5VYQ8_9HYPO|nr:pisatin demethylase cytochrome P450 [Fusarium tjaetaba]KAF5642512.1 pisatin demethylase cytochrome P450 [Fusarium tjaetaba]
MLLTEAHLETPQAFGAAFIVGVLVHIFVLRKGEWDLWTVKLIKAWATYEVTVSLFLTQLYSFSVWQALSVTNKWFASFVTGLSISILTYRAYFHRLNRFPGPFLARLSTFYATYLTVDEEHMYLEVQKLHEKPIHAPSSPVIKSPFYGITHPWVMLLSERRKKEHATRRKAWDRAFTTKALRDYEHRVLKYTKLLTDRIDEAKGKPFNVALWVNFYTFDIMGDLAFGKSFDMLESGVEHNFFTESHKTQGFMGAFRRLVWFFPLVSSIPIVNSSFLAFQAYIRNQVETRRKNKPAEPDVFSSILEDYDAMEKPTQQDFDNLCGDAHLIVIAGSDTTSSSTTCLLHNLVLHPDVLAKLQAEIDEYKNTHDEYDLVSLSKLQYLQACIDESLRLYPVVPSGVPRMTPPEGMQLDDVYIPGDTIIHSPSYTMYRDERCFEKPNEFIPERWTTKPELIKDASVYAPFHTGRGVCAGKQLGLMEMRYVLMDILSRYDIDFAPGTNPQAFINGLRDCYTLELPRLDMVFTPRTGAKVEG